MTPKPPKSFVLRVTTVGPCFRAVVAIMPSGTPRGRPVNWRVPVKPAPSRGNLLRYGQNPPLKQEDQKPFKPRLQLLTPLSVRRDCEAHFQLTYAHHTQKQRADILCRYPVLHSWFRA